MPRGEGDAAGLGGVLGDYSRGNGKYLLSGVGWRESLQINGSEE